MGLRELSGKIVYFECEVLYLKTVLVLLKCEALYLETVIVLERLAFNDDAVGLLDGLFQ
jgi:hypothetical protein